MPKPWIPAALLFLLALAPRVIAHERFVTVDETAHWVRRTEGFLEGLRTLDPRLTNQAPHPGVTTMWAASSGLAVHEALAGAELRDDTRENRLAAMRLPVALIVSAAVAAAFLLLRRVADERAAFVGALLWAGEPFLVGHSRIVHVDAMVASWLTLCLLAGFVAIREDSRRWWAVSGALGGLAFLSKLPAAIALPFLLLPYAYECWDRRRGPAVSQPLVWIGAFAAVFVACWPAVPFAPFGAFRSVETGVDWAVSPHERGNFFLGEPVDDPGMLFYPVAVALRLAPWTALGVLAAALLWRRVDRPTRWFFLYTVLFLLFVGLQAKKFDRYALPVFPWLDLLAGAGLVAAFDAVVARGGGLPVRRWSAPVAASALAALLAANLAWAHPYELLWYDPLLGGGKTAQKLVLVGWGEGMPEAGDWLRENASCDTVVAVHHATREVLKPFVCQKLVTLQHVDEAEIIVLYVNHIQREDNARLMAKLRKSGPDYVVTRAGIDLVEIYDLRAER